MVCICLSHFVADEMAAPNGLYMSHTVSSEHQSVSNVLGKMVASKGLHLFVTYCCRQDGGATWSAFVCHILLQARWRRDVDCLCLSHLVEGKLAAPRGLYLFVTYCCRQDDGAKWSICTIVHVQNSIRALIFSITITSMYCG